MSPLAFAFYLLVCTSLQVLASSSSDCYVDRVSGQRLVFAIQDLAAEKRFGWKELLVAKIYMQAKRQHVGNKGTIVARPAM